MKKLLYLLSSVLLFISTISFSYGAVNVVDFWTTSTENVSISWFHIDWLKFSSDWSKLFVLYSKLNTTWKIKTYSLWIPYDVSSQTWYTEDSVRLNTRWMTFNNDWTKMFLSNNNSWSNKVYEFDLSPAWEITWNVYNSINITTDGWYMESILFNDDWTKLYINDTFWKIETWSLSTWFDLTTASKTLDTTISEDTWLFDFYFSSDWSSLYLA